MVKKQRDGIISKITDATAKHRAELATKIAAAKAKGDTKTVADLEAIQKKFEASMTERIAKL